MAASKYNAETLAASFGLSASIYDASRLQLIPCFRQFYGSVVKLLDFAPGSEPRILDLGVGTGLLSAWVLDKYPNARLSLIDIAPEMLEKARQRLSAARYAPQLIVGDYSEMPLGGPFEAIVSSLSIHHLDDVRKQRLFSKIHEALAGNGIFVNAEQVAAPTAHLEEFYVETWLAEVRHAGLNEEDLNAAKERMNLDRHVTVDVQMNWLREAGFREVDLWFKSGRFAVYSGRK